MAKERDFSQIVPFPLFHGTSNHYLSAFKPEAIPTNWPHKGVALNLLHEAWTALQAFDREPDLWVKSVLNQESGRSNWQHGELYVTPSIQSAVRYAAGGAACGGELLTYCQNALSQLTQLDGEKAERLAQNAVEIGELIKGSGLPILVEFTNVRVGDLLPETNSGDVFTALSSLSSLDDRMRTIMGQQTNFRLKPGRGIVGRVFELEIRDVDDPVSPFNLNQIFASELWD